MKAETDIEKLLECLDITLQMSREWYMQSLDKAIEDGYISLCDLKTELAEAISSNPFEWKTKAIQFNLICSNREQFTKIDLVNYLNLNIWKWCLPDERPTIEEKRLIEKTIEESEYLDTINCVMDRVELALINFGIRQQFKCCFSIEEYENRDIVHHLKSMCWTHLFPNYYSSLEKSKDSKFANDLLREVN